MKTRFLLTLTLAGALWFCAALLCATTARAKDTFVFAGAQLTLPEGWTIQLEGRMATLLPPPGKRAFVEVYRFSKVPPADLQTISGLLKPRKNTTEVSVTKTATAEQNGLKGTSAQGVAKIKGVPVRFKLIALPLGDHAVLAIWFVVETEAASKLGKDLDAVLGSLRATASPKAGADPPVTAGDAATAP